MLYEGRAGEEQTYTQKEEFSEGKESRSMDEMERRKKERERDSQQEIERATEEANKADEKEIADEKKVNKEETVEEEKVNKEEIEKPKSDKRNISTKININTANAKELESLKGIGPATAKNIISYREEYGGFSTIEEIMNVKRIGEKTFAKIQDQISVE